LAGTGCGAARSTERAAARDSPAGADVTRELGCVSSAAEVCYNATDDNCNGILDEGCGIETGPVQFMIAWEPALADVDLLVSDPAGELAEVGHPLASGLVKQRDCPGRNNECRGQSYENVFLEAAEAPHGTYTVRVMLESLGGENPPIHVRFGARVGPRTYGYALDLNLPHSLHDANFVW
jgi:tRNA (guanosine-2'-O-)-methyltransferase